MANSIELFKKNAPELLDKVYKSVATTADFDMNGALVKAGANANEIIIPKLSMDGLGDYSRNSGYTDGDITLNNETVKFNYERGRRLKTDVIDSEETGGVIMANLSSEFLRTKVVPELDAVRYATYSALEGITDVASDGVTYADGQAVLTALESAMAKMTNDEVPEEDRHLRITSDLLSKAQYVARNVNNDILTKFASVKVVPQSRFYTAIELNDGVSEGEKIGGYKKASTGKDINFMIIHKPALLQYTKHAKMKIFTPEQDQDGDNYKMLYRIYGLNDAYENKVAGIVVSHKA